MNASLQVVETNNQRVLTTAQIAEQYKTSTDAIQRNFNRNKERYTKGKHYYCLTGDALREFKATGQIDVSPNLNKFYLWTEKGALLHAKSLNTDKAWEAYEVLVDTYFSVHQQMQLPQHNSERIKALEVKEMNARVRMSNQFLKLANVDTSMSKDYKAILIAKSAQVLAGEEILPLPKSKQKMYTATEIGNMFGVSKQKIGAIANQHGLKVAEYGEFYKDKSPYSNKEVDAFRYNDDGVAQFRKLLG